MIYLPVSHTPRFIGLPVLVDFGIVSTRRWLTDNLRQLTINCKERIKLKALIRNVLLSTGELVPEVVLTHNGHTVYESSARGLTTGSSEPSLAGSRDSEIAEKLAALDPETTTQEQFDSIVTEYGTNVATAASLAYLRLRAALKGLEVPEVLAEQGDGGQQVICNVLNGSSHAGSGLAFCENMILMPPGDFTDQIAGTSAVYLELRGIITEKYGASATSVGREGGFTPPIRQSREAMDLLNMAIEKSGVECNIAIDVAANEFFRDGAYDIDGQRLSSDELVAYYLKMVEDYPRIAYLEDPFHEDDSNGWSSFYAQKPARTMQVGDDLTSSQAPRVEQFAPVMDAVILKPNQAHTLTGLIAAAHACKKHNLHSIMSQRSGETESSLIIDLGIGLGSGFFKIGAPARERIIKYNRLLRISQPA